MDIEKLITKIKDDLDILCPCEVQKLYTVEGKVSKFLIQVDALITHKSPPKGYPSNKEQYADPANFKYPINSKSRVLAAWRYINKPNNQKGYSTSQVAAIKSRIKRAAKKYGLNLEEGD